jgi:hypothetical protein
MGLKLRSFAVFSVSILVFAIDYARQSDQFKIQNISVTTSFDDRNLLLPVSKDDIIAQMTSLTQRQSLLDLDLQSLRARLLNEEWIRSVRFEKHLPSTLEINVEFREPIALFQEKSGKISYVGKDAKVFGAYSLKWFANLPLLTGISSPLSPQIKKAVTWIGLWENSKLPPVATLSTLNWNKEYGFRALATYTYLGVEKNSIVRTTVDLGQEIDVPEDKVEDKKLFQIFSVFRHLKRNAISVRKMWSDHDNRIIVKVTQNS